MAILAARIGSWDLDGESLRAVTWHPASLARPSEPRAGRVGGLGRDK